MKGLDVCMAMFAACRNGVLLSLERNGIRTTGLPSVSVAPGTVTKATATTEAVPTSAPRFHVYYNDVYRVELPKGHRFPMEMYGRVRRLLQQRIRRFDAANAGRADDGDRDGHATHVSDRVRLNFTVSPLATENELATTHSSEYIRRFLTGDQTEAEQRNVGFPWSPSGVNRALSSVGGTLAAACRVCDEWNNDSDSRLTMPPWGAHIAGGTHHAFYDRGEGFCVFSDIAVAANVVLQRYSDTVKRILIVDLDVHQGNGNAVLFHNRPEVATFSMHCEGNYFSEKQHSDLDIELPIGCNDRTYLSTLHHWLRRIEQIGGRYDLIFFQAGVDVLADDRLGRMELTRSGVSQRNRMVYDFATRMRVPLVICMGGGYPRTNDWTPIIEAHTNVYYEAYRYLWDQAAVAGTTSTDVVSVDGTGQ